jgi:uncharacterized coiled-coil protein SlyX
MALESAYYGAAGEKITYGNLGGRELLEEKHDLKERMKRLEDKQANSGTEIANLKTEIANLKAEIADRETQISYLQDRVKALTLASDGYRKIRHRFLEIYRQDIRGTLTEKDIRKLATVMKSPIKAMRLLMQNFTPPTNDLARMF